MKRIKEVITYRDLLWSLIVSIAITITILSIRLGDNKDVVDIFGLLSSVISIVLAIISIVYTFSQNLLYSSANEKLETSTVKLQNVSEQLTEIDSITEKLNSLSGIESRISAVMSSIEESLCSKMDLQKSDLANMLDERMSQITITTEKDEQNSLFSYTKEQLVKILIKSNVQLICVIYYAYRTSESKKIIKIKELLSIIENKDDVELPLGFYYAALQVYASFGAFDYKFKNKENGIANFNSNLADAICEVVKIVKEHPEKYKSITEKLLSIDKYFDNLIIDA